MDVKSLAKEASTTAAAVSALKSFWNWLTKKPDNFAVALLDRLVELYGKDTVEHWIDQLLSEKKPESIPLKNNDKADLIIIVDEFKKIKDVIDVTPEPKPSIVESESSDLFAPVAGKSDKPQQEMSYGKKLLSDYQRHIHEMEIKRT